MEQQRTDGIDPFVWRIGIVPVLWSIMSILDPTIVTSALDTLHRRSALLDQPDPVGRDRVPAVAGGTDPRHRLGGRSFGAEWDG